MIPPLPVLLVGVCLVQGQVLRSDGRAIPGAEVAEARSGLVLATTAHDGSFVVRLPEAEGVDALAEVALEFRAAGSLPAVRRARCGASLEIRLVPRVYELRPLEISATRLERTFARSPVRVDRLDAQAVRETAASSPSLAQAVQQLPGIGAVGRDGFTSAPTIRGLGRDRSLILLEGVRISSDRGVGPTASFLDPFLVRTVDVVRGASGVAYGSGAIGGVVSVGLTPAESTFSAAVRIAGATNGDGRLAAGRIAGRVGSAWRASMGLFVRAHEDYSFPSEGAEPRGEAENSGFENAGGAIALERPAGNGAWRVVLLGTTADDVGRPTTKPRRRDTIEAEDHALAAVRFTEGSGAARTELLLGFHRPRTVNRTERFDDAGRRTRTGRVENRSLDFTAAALMERPRAGGAWVAGLDLFARVDVDAVETNVRFAPDGSSVPSGAEKIDLVGNATRLDLGVFGGWKRSIGLLGELLAAARLDLARRGADERSSSRWISPSLSLGFVRPLNAHWALTGSVGRSFRSPRIQELYFAGDRPGGSRLANPDLDPETAWSAEGGVRWSRGSWTANVAVWGLRASDLIVQLPVDAGADTLRHENESEGRLAGAEGELAWIAPGGGARASVGYAYVRGEDDRGDPLPDIPSAELRIAAEVRAWGDPAGRSATFRGSLRAGGAKIPVGGGREERWWSGLLGSGGIGGDEVGHPGFARWDAGVRLRIHRRALLDLSVANVLDARYLDRPESSAYPQPGRSFQVELTLGE